MAAMKRLAAADDDELLLIVKHDPDMIRDVAKKCVRCGGSGEIKGPPLVAGICCPDCRGTGSALAAAKKS